MRQENTTVSWGYTHKGGKFLLCTDGVRLCLASYYCFLGPLSHQLGDRGEMDS